MTQHSIRISGLGAWFRSLNCAVICALVVLIATTGHGYRCQASDLSEKRLPVLTTARGVHGLTPEQASLAYPVRLRGVVTFYDPYQEGHKALFIADETGSVFVAPGLGPILPLHTGSRVEVSGVSDPGGFAPIVTNSEIRILPGSQPLPLAHTVTLPHLLAGGGRWTMGSAQWNCALGGARRNARCADCGHSGWHGYGDN
jgi:hypothetical protein